MQHKERRTFRFSQHRTHLFSVYTLHIKLQHTHFERYASYTYNTSTHVARRETHIPFFSTQNTFFSNTEHYLCSSICDTSNYNTHILCDMCHTHITQSHIYRTHFFPTQNPFVLVYMWHIKLQHIHFVCVVSYKHNTITHVTHRERHISFFPTQYTFFFSRAISHS